MNIINIAKPTGLSELIAERLVAHHNLYPVIKVKDYLWEHTLFDCLRIMLPDENLVWNYGSQQIGKDIELNKINIDISCKSGQIHSNKKVKISSSSLSRFDGDENLIKEYVTTKKTEDFVYCLSTYKEIETIYTGFVKYKFMVFDHNLVDFDNGEWSKFGKNNDLYFQDKYGTRLTITKAMGWQVWYYLPIERAKHSVNFNISVRDFNPPKSKLPI